MGWFAYSLQEVFSYFILSPRCLYDGSKVAYGGREGLVTPPDGAKLASRWLQVASRWLQAVPILAFGSQIRSKKPYGRLQPPPAKLYERLVDKNPLRTALRCHLFGLFLGISWAILGPTCGHPEPT